MTNPTAGEPGTAVAQTPRASLIEQARHRIEPFLPPGVSLDRVVQAVYLATRENPAIANCTPESIVRAVARVAQWGLEVGTTAHLVPFGEKCTPVADYKGLVELMVMSGAIRRAEAACVYAGDHFEIEKGLTPKLEHRPETDPAKRGKVIGAYCILRLPRYESAFEFMPLADIDAIRLKHSKSWKNGECPPWYAMKTVIRQAAKLVPKNPRLLKVLAEVDAGEIPDGEFSDAPAAEPGQPLPREYQLGRPLAGQSAGFEYEGQQELDVREPVRRNTAQQVDMPKPGRVADAFRAEAQAASERYIEHAGQPAPADDDLALDRELAADEQALPFDEPVAPRKRGRDALREP